jgi:quinol monooxygenase YgiN
MKNRKAIAAVALVLIGLAIRSTWPVSVRGDEKDESISVVTHVDVIPPFTADGRKLLQEFATATRLDPGLVRVEVFEELGRPNHSTVVEVWKSKKAYEVHLATDHVKAYRAKLQPMLGSPFDERLHRQVR